LHSGRLPALALGFDEASGARQGECQQDECPHQSRKHAAILPKL
jgi:hypothetical protein